MNRGPRPRRWGTRRPSSTTAVMTSRAFDTRPASETVLYVSRHPSGMSCKRTLPPPPPTNARRTALRGGPSAVGRCPLVRVVPKPSTTVARPCTPTRRTTRGCSRTESKRASHSDRLPMAENVARCPVDLSRERDRRVGERRGASWLKTALVAVAFFALGVALYWPVWRRHPTSTTPLGGDQWLSTWALTWAYKAVTSFHNPFFTDYANYPTGVNLLNNAEPDPGRDRRCADHLALRADRHDQRRG